MAKALKWAVSGMAATLLAVAAPLQAAPAPVPPEIPVALLVDLSTGQTLYAREPNRRFVPASVTKVMTAYSAFKMIAEGEIRPSTRFQITPELEDEWYGEGSNMFLKAGEQPTFGELLLGATTVSGNDACVAIANAATGSLSDWIDLMNRDAAQLGMRDTHFGSANGYPDGGRTFTTASDLATLARATITRYPDLYRRYFGHRTLTWRDITQTNHDPLTGRVEGADGLKTGYTNEAGYTFLGSGERNGRRLVMVLAGSPTSRLRDETARAFLEWGFDDFTTRKLAPAGIELGHARVQDGAVSQVGLRAPDGVTLAYPRGAGGAVETRIVYRGPLAAPIEKGEAIASLRITVEGQQPYDIPLVAAQDVLQANAWQRLYNGLAGWLG